jgi:regulator of replication initiation timing
MKDKEVLSNSEFLDRVKRLEEDIQKLKEEIKYMKRGLGKALSETTRY